jgi:hypothetical protein
MICPRPAGADSDTTGSLKEDRISPAQAGLFFAFEEALSPGGSEGSKRPSQSNLSQPPGD